MQTSIDVPIRSPEDDRLDIVTKRVDVLSNSSLLDGAFHDTLEGDFTGWMGVDQAAGRHAEVFVLIGGTVVAGAATRNGVEI